MVSSKVLKASNTTKTPVTPGTKVRQLQGALENKEKENETLKNTIADLTNALNGLNIVKEKVNLDTNGAETKKGKKDENAPVPAKTAYKFFCEAVPKQDGVDMRQVWKESSPDVRKKYTDMAEQDKARYQSEFAKYNEEKTALDMFYQKKKQDTAMEFLEAHAAAQAAIEKVEAEKNKGKKTKKDPEAPKRPMSAYMYFTMEKRESVAKNNPESPVTEISKILGEMWTVTKGKKGKNGTKKFDDMAAKDKARYEEEKAAYDAMIEKRNMESEQEKVEQFVQDKEDAMNLMKALQEEEEAKNAPTEGQEKKQKKKKDPNAPKKALSAYIFFCNDKRATIKAKMPENTTQPDLMKELGRQWKEVTDKSKAKYIKMADKDKVRYEKEMKKYNAGKN
mmetsp:Transcript_23542/g.35608  ORF Transcript_23542/g.35608 Transcript_23542/m.35608 type:complete len:393 (+) Transcript_23542:110-1288(+)|eukprot:CAMPEP_0194210512 /NCGR_PEP_ID=MMETSP0156-20130528/8634_1 /TAXON_ID=33649 /ORGANISM="Thalassionema nitzschioides, Strain L26-B" /LENGTH=392 /DNA_ID=CAMNT_0038937869 /DNA_START=65 /DNA_END=1243 /DNA_ORIENTATION=+